MNPGDLLKLLCLAVILFIVLESMATIFFRWNDFESTISSSFRELRQTSEFFDVTLCCDNGTDTIQAHKVILVLDVKSP